MEILNYTGKRIGLTNPSGYPIEVLPSHGFAKVDVTLAKANPNDTRFSIFAKEFSRVMNLPDADRNNNKMYIVTKDVAEAIGKYRVDLLIPEDSFTWEGATFYKMLVRTC